MDVLLNALRKSIDHLRILDEIMTTENHPNRQLYREIKNRIRTVDKEGDFIRFSESLYVGGKKEPNMADK